MEDLSVLKDSEFLAQVEKLRGVENTSGIKLLAHLVEVERRDLHKELGYSSLFSYCTEKLGYSSSSATRRISAVKVIRFEPSLYELLVSGEVTLHAVTLVCPLIGKVTGEILKEVVRLSAKEIEEYVFGYKPEVKKPKETVRPIRVSKGKAVKVELPLFEQPVTFSAERRKPLKSHSQEIETEERVEIRFSIKKSDLKKVEEAKRALSTKHPKGVSFEDLVLEALDLIISKKRPKAKKVKAVQVARPIKKQPRVVSEPVVKAEKPSRFIPIDVKRRVSQRDGNQCTYVAPSGKRCSCTWNLQYDHIQPFALGGATTEDNLRLLCASHNRHLSQKTFGKFDYRRLKNHLK